MFIGRCARIAWTAEVNTVRSVLPPPSLPPPGGGAGFPPPAGEIWGEGRPLRCNVLRLEQGSGETRFPHSPACGRVWAGVARAQTCGETGFPHVKHA